MKHIRRMISLLLALVMVIGTVPPMAVRAGEVEAAVPVTEVTEETAAPSDPAGEEFTETEAEPEASAAPSEAAAEPETSEAAASEPEDPVVSAEETVVEYVTAYDAMGAASSGTCGENLTWTLDNGVLTISGEGPMKDFTYYSDWDETDSGWDMYAGQVKKVVIENGVTSIGTYAFYEMPSLTEVIIGDGVETIGWAAFSHCNYVTKLTIGKNVRSIAERAFNGWVRLEELHISDLTAWCAISGERPCGWDYYDVYTYLYLNGNKLTEIVIPEDVTLISAAAFGGYSGITSITIPDTVTVIGSGAFSCPDLKTIFYLGDLSQWILLDRGGPICRYGVNISVNGTILSDVAVPSDLTEIGNYAFANTKITGIELHDGIRRIGTGAFENCIDLPGILLPENLEELSSRAMYGCTALTEIVIPDSVKTVGDQAFELCTGLAAITLSAGMDAIPSRMMFGCSSLKEILIPEAVKTIGNSAFENCSVLEHVTNGVNLISIDSRSFYDCTQLQSMAWSESLATIGQEAFYNCSALGEIILNSQVESIGSYAFTNCSGATKITISSAKLNTIEVSTFSGCSQFTQVCIPGSVSTIDAYAFSSCSALSTVRFEGNMPTISDTAFSGVSAVCYYPEGNETYTKDMTTLDFGGDLRWTYDGEIISNLCGETVTWNLDENGTLTISGTGAMYDYSAEDLEYAPWYEQRSSIQSVVVEDGVTTIGNYAFSECKNIATASIPNSVVRIGNHAFYYCKISTITLPAELQEVGGYAFAFTNLTSIKLPDTVTAIGIGAFCRCNVLKSAYLPDNLEAIPNYCFSTCPELRTVTYPASLKAIGHEAFTGCYGLAGPVLPEGLISIGDYAFEGCGYSHPYYSAGFYSISFPSTLETIGSGAFVNCDNLKTITIPKKVKVIPVSCFEGCDDLESVILPAGLNALEKKAFSMCNALKSVKFQWDVPEFADIIFSENVTATCYYPSNNTEWTADVRLQYGGNITWVGEFMDNPGLGGEDDDDSDLEVDNGSGDNKDDNTEGNNPDNPGDSGDDNGGSTPGGDNGNTPGTGTSCQNGHTFGDWEETTAPTCEEKGEKQRTCTVCGGTETEEVPALGHTEVIDEAVAPTCTESGLTEGSHCSVCEEVLLPQETVPAAHTVENNICTVCGRYGICGDDVTWDLTDETVMVISGTGAMWDYQLAGKVNTPNNPWYDLRESVYDIYVSEGITHLGNWTFADMESVTYVDLPDTLVSMGHGCLSGCSALEEIILPDGIITIGASTFNGCLSLAALEIPNGVTRIEEFTFYDCAALPEIEIPEGVTYIGESAFCGCESLTEIVIPEGVTAIDILTFDSCSSLESIVLPKNLVTIGSMAFQNCSSLQQIAIPDSVTTLESGVFENCSSLQQIVLPQSVVTLGGSLFRGCTALTDVTIAGPVTMLPGNIFSMCENLSEIVIPESVEEIAGGAFYGCSSLSSITIPKNVKMIRSRCFVNSGTETIFFEGNAPAFHGSAFVDLTATAYYPRNNTTWTPDVLQDYGGTITWEIYGDLPENACGENVVWTLSEDGTLTVSGIGDMWDFESYDAESIPWYASRDQITAVHILPGVTGIGDNAFAECWNLKTAAIPEGVTRIGFSAFEACSNLTGIVLPDSVIRIDAYAFYGCDQLKGLTLSANLETIGVCAFMDCWDLQEIRIPESVTSIGEYAFRGTYPDMVYFAGNAPAVELINYSSVFGTASAYAYYPANDDTWTEEIRANYGTYLKWISYEGDIYSGVCGDDLTYSMDQQTGTLTISGTGPMYEWDDVSTVIPWGGYAPQIRRIIIGADVTSYYNLGAERCQIIIFQGNAPQIFADNAFEDMYGAENGTVICYPYNDSSWDPYVGEQFGGRVTWYEQGSPVAILRNLSAQSEGLSPEEIREEMKKLDRKDLLDAMRSGILDYDDYGWGEISILDSATGSTSEILFNDVPELNALGSSRHWRVEGMALNDPVDADAGFALVYSKSENPIPVPEGYDAASAIPFRISITNLLRTDYLTIPVKAAMNFAREDANPFFYSLFWRSNSTGQIEEIPLRISWHKSGYHMNYVMEGTGEFLLVCRTDIMTGTCGEDLVWTYDQNSTLTISGTGAMYDYGLDQNQAPWHYFREEVNGLVIGENVTRIGNYAFEDCRFLHQLIIPASVREIGEGAFHGMHNVNMMRFEGDAPVIEENAFFDMACSAYYDSAADGWTETIQSVYGAQCYEYYGFRWVPLVNSGICGENLTWRFEEDSGILTVSGTGDMFHYSTQSSDWEEEVAPWTGFADQIRKVVIEEGVTSIGALTFYMCSNLQEITIADSVITIAEASLPYMEELYIPKGVRRMYFLDVGASCGSIHVDPDNEVYASIDGVLFSKDKTSLLKYPSNRTGAYTVPEGVTSIGEWAFANNLGLTAVILPESLRTIGWIAFSYTGLTEVTIPDNVTKIGSSAFASCPALQKVTFGKSVSSIGDWAFTCQMLKEIVFTGSAPLFGEDVFQSATAEAYYPAGDNTWTSDVLQNYGGTVTWIPDATAENRITVDDGTLNSHTSVWIDGTEYPVKTAGTTRYVDLPDGSAKTMVAYTYHTDALSDIHKQYPISMKVWMLSCEDGFYTADRVEELDDILQYSGSSIRVTGKKGVRMITSIAKDKKSSLTSEGLAGYTLKEYGTAVAWANQLGDTKPLVLGRSYVKSNYAYRKDVADPVFAYQQNLMQYTNVLVGFTDAQCKQDLAMRPYMILENAAGEEITLYGGTVIRSIGYIAYQNRNAFTAGTEAYEYVWNIIHSVYGNAYDAEYRT